MLEQLGFSLARRESHDIYTKPGHSYPVTVPRDRKEVTQGTLGSIWRQAGVTKADAEAIREGLGR